MYQPAHSDPVAARQRLADEAAAAAAEARRNAAWSRVAYATGALTVVCLVLSTWLARSLDWAVAVPSATLALVLVLAGLRSGRLW